MAWRNKTVGDIENPVIRRAVLCALVLPFMIATVGLSIGAGLTGIIRDQIHLYQAFMEGFRK